MVEPTTLVTGRLILRPARLADADFMFERASDPEFGRFLPLPQPYTRRDAESFLASIVLRSWDTNPSFIITREGEPVGDVNIRIDATHRTAEMGWGMHPRFWGQGLTTEAARAVMDWAFDTFGLAKVLARCDAGNIGSWRVMEKLGMAREGRLRAHRLLRGERRDEFIYGALCGR